MQRKSFLEFPVAILAAFALTFTAACDEMPAEPDGSSLVHVLQSSVVAGASTVVVHPGDMGGECTHHTEANPCYTAFPGGWLFYNDENDHGEPSIGSFVVGPDAPPFGNGSIQMNVSGSERRNLATFQFAGTALADITEMRFSTYNPAAGNGGSANRSGYLHFNVSLDGTDTWQGRLVYVPQTNGTVVQNGWQEWDAITDGTALWSHTRNAWSGLKTWADILAEYPDAKIRDTDAFFGIRVGEPYADGYTEYLDGVVFGTTAGGVLTFDFEPDGHAPLVIDVAADPVAVGATGTVTATVDDSGTGNSGIASASLVFNSGSATGMTAVDGALDTPVEAVSGSFTAPTEPGLYEACVTGSDATGHTGGPECIMVAVYDPSGGFVTGGGWIESPAGAMTLTSAVWDQGFEADAAGWLDSDDAWYGTVTRVESGTGGISSSTGSWHAVMEGGADSGPFTRFDGYRDSWPGSWTAEVDVYLDPSWGAGEGFDYSVAASGTDNGHQRDFIFHVGVHADGRLLVNGSNNTDFSVNDHKLLNDGDGTPYEVTVAGWYTLQHVFRDDAGALAVDLNLLDANGAIVFTTTRYNAADVIPTEVGGNRYGWFTFISVDGGIGVDEHQLLMSLAPTGKASFGFNAKYKRGAKVPDGSTQFSFKAGNLDFHSTTYDWLVVNQNGENAQFKGVGTIDGVAGEYQFMVWAGDHDIGDVFRIKIWEKDNESNVVYDNGTDQLIGGGNIMVHDGRKK